MIGRRKPYTQIGIRRKNCIRCGAKALYQWNACAIQNRWVPVCRDCDIGLNRMALEYMRVPSTDELIAAYEKIA